MNILSSDQEIASRLEGYMSLNRANLPNKASPAPASGETDNSATAYIA
jgi:hypothetical protein